MHFIGNEKIWLALGGPTWIAGNRVPPAFFFCTPMHFIGNEKIWLALGGPTWIAGNRGAKDFGHVSFCTLWPIFFWLPMQMSVENFVYENVCGLFFFWSSVFFVSCVYVLKQAFL